MFGHNKMSKNVRFLHGAPKKGPDVKQNRVK